MSDHLVRASIVSNVRTVCQTKQSWVNYKNKKLSNDVLAQYLYGWLSNNCKYCKQSELYVPDFAILSK